MEAWTWLRPGWEPRNHELSPQAAGRVCADSGAVGGRSRMARLRHDQTRL